ncbi:hypothetical protein PYW07_013416 [Mythimna separata]|uniref:Uncharacterized protein n=1 Tax=Mythimna separata TaxID=271217 RepID=A0AAD8DJK9_MYTSE|nr:hypothetical protein PYW07_013416 [Mythimna separata]
MIILKARLASRNAKKSPEFLRKEEVDWPAPRTFKKETTGEEKTVDVVATASTRHPSPDPERFSSWKRLWRATARVLQFIQLCKKKEKVHAAKNDPAWKMTTSKKTKTDGKVIRPSNVQDRRYIPLDAELLEQAEALLLKGSQERCFREDIKCVQQEKQPEGSSKLRKLDVVYEDGLLRLKGRIDAIQGISREYKRPIVLDSKDKTTRDMSITPRRGRSTASDVSTDR